MKLHDLEILSFSFRKDVVFKLTSRCPQDETYNTLPPSHFPNFLASQFEDNGMNASLKTDPHQVNRLVHRESAHQSIIRLEMTVIF